MWVVAIAKSAVAPPRADGPVVSALKVAAALFVVNRVVTILVEGEEASAVAAAIAAVASRNWSQHP